MTDASKKQIEQIVQEACAKIREHVDTVQIFITKHDDEDGGNVTVDYNYGSGNYYARIGLVREWLTFQEQHQRNHATRIDAEDEEEDP